MPYGARNRLHLPRVRGRGRRRNAEVRRIRFAAPTGRRALVEAGGGNWDEASAELEKFEAAWGSIDSAPAGEAAAAVSEALTAAKEAVRHEDADDAKTRLSTLAKQVNEFIQSGGDRAETDAMGKEAAGRLLKMVNNTLKPLESGNPDEAQSRFKQILDGWSKMEGPIRSGHFGVYSDVETHMSLVRIALQADPVKTEQRPANCKSWRICCKTISAASWTIRPPQPSPRPDKPAWRMRSLCLRRRPRLPLPAMPQGRRSKCRPSSLCGPALKARFRFPRRRHTQPRKTA